MAAPSSSRFCFRAAHQIRTAAAVSENGRRPRAVIVALELRQTVRAGHARPHGDGSSERRVKLGLDGGVGGVVHSVAVHGCTSADFQTPAGSDLAKVGETRELRLWN